MKNPDNCPICGRFMDVICTGHNRKPFIDGRCYEAICQLCFETPCLGRYESNVWKTYSLSDGELHTADELSAHGFDKKEATISIKAVKKALKKKKKIP
jgi:hypothetical protein